jgi:3-deoxy-7-phosphoheptulonate synthase
MIIQLEPGINPNHIEGISNQAQNLGYKITEVKTQSGHYLVGIGKKAFDIRRLGNLPGILDIHRVSDDFKMVSSKWKLKGSTVSLGDGINIGPDDFSVMLGPCSIEGEDQIRAVIGHLKQTGVKIMRGGVYKPRSSPYSFRGLGQEGLQLWHKLAQEAGIKIISEVMQVAQIEEMYPYVDIFQVGARNTQNFNLLDELGKVDKPVLIKRGISGTIDELLYSAEYVFSAGNEELLLCERGIRTYEKASRNTLDLNAVPILKEKSHLPVIVDPSHGIGIRRFVEPMALASIMSGADGLILEIAPVPEKAASDGQQTLNFAESESMVKKINATIELRRGMATY